jgi:phosphomannomutase
MKHKLNKSILKACDIRGVYNKELNEEDFYYIGKAFATILKKKNLKVCSVGRDGRLSSPTLAEALIKGLLECNIDVIDIGFVSTPALYYSHRLLNTGGSCMVSASHNPSKYNGCKFVIKDEVFSSKYVKEIDDICQNDKYEAFYSEGSITKYDIREDYINHLLPLINLESLSDSNIVWDAGNGASLFMLESLIKHLPGTHTIICGEVDGSFPNHEPDPCKEENMSDLKEAVIKYRADLGIAFDGDGDRLGCITKNGKFVTGEQLLLILAKDYLNDYPGSKIMSEVKASKVLYSEISNYGGIPVMWKVGHTFQQEKAIEENIGLAGETSGHIFYEANNFEDDGTYAAFKLLDILYYKDKTSLDNHLDMIPSIFSKGEIRLVMNSQDRESLIQKLNIKLKDDNRDFIAIDGVRVECSDGFWLIRGSNTQPQITTYVEAFSETTYEDTFNDMKSYLSYCGFDYYELLKKKDN